MDEDRESTLEQEDEQSEEDALAAGLLEEEARVAEEDVEEDGLPVPRYVVELDVVGEAQRYREAGCMPLLDPRLEEFCRQYVALAGKLGRAARSAGLDKKQAWRLMRRSPLVRARIRWLADQYLSSITREEIIGKMVSWMKEARPNERVRIAEILLKLQGAFPVQQMQVVSVIQGGTRYVQAAQTLREHAAKLDTEKLRAIRAHLEEELSGIQEALRVLDDLARLRALPGVASSEH